MSDPHQFMKQIRVLIVDLDPSLIDLSDSPYKELGLAPVTLRIIIDKNVEHLREKGYDADFFGTDTGKTAPDLLKNMLSAKVYDCIVMSAGIRLVPRHTRLLERLLNLAQVIAKDAIILFDTNPLDTIPTVQHWFSAGWET